MEDDRVRQSPEEKERHKAEAQGLRTEIIDAAKARANFQKWKLGLVAALGAAALGVGGNGTTRIPLLLCGIPLVCGYVDLLCKHITLRILVIGTYLRKLNEANEPPDKILDYEGFVEKARKRFDPYELEDRVMYRSTKVLSAAVAGYGLVSAAQECSSWWPSWCYLFCMCGKIWPYLLSGLLGLFMSKRVRSVGQDKEQQLEELEVTR